MSSSSCSEASKGSEVYCDSQEGGITIIKINMSEVSPEDIQAARDLDTSHDLWTARMIRWVKYKWSPKSLICGIKWENKQDEDHFRETLKEWRQQHLPGYRPVQSEGKALSVCTADLSDTAWNARMYQRSRDETIIRLKKVLAKHKAGEVLDAGEQFDLDDYYQRWKDEPAFSDNEAGSAVNVANGYFDHDDDADLEGSSDFKDHESQYSRSSLASSVSEVEYDDWGMPIREKTLCSARIGHRLNICIDYDMGRRGKDYKFPCGMGKHIRAPCNEMESRVSIIGEDVLDNMPSTNPRDIAENGAQVKVFEYFPSEFKSNITVEYMAKKLEQIRDEATGSAEDEPLDAGAPFYDPEICYKDNSWLAEANPVVTKEMITLQNESAAAHDEETTSTALAILEDFGIDLDLIVPTWQLVLEDYSDVKPMGVEGILHAKITATAALDILKELSSDLESLLPVALIFLKNSKLCQAIYKELVNRDTGFLQNENGTKDFRFHGRVETVLNSLHRWAAEDIESAIEDIRLILQDEELLVEIIEALNGSNTKYDRPLIDPKGAEKTCAQCEKNLEELAVIYGRDHSTVMVSGCRVCEDLRLKRAYKLLWKWRKNPSLVNDEQYEKIFGVPKGFKIPKRREEKSIGNFDLEEEFEENHEENHEAYHEEDLEEDLEKEMQ